VASGHDVSHRTNRDGSRLCRGPGSGLDATAPLAR
jgi:hypothetical protein